MAIDLPLISKFSQSTCFPASASTSNIQQFASPTSHSPYWPPVKPLIPSLFCSEVIHNFLCIILALMKIVKNRNTLIIPLPYVLHRQKFENNASSIKNFEICLCKCIQKDPEVHKNKLNKSQWDGISFFLEKRNKTPQIFFLSPVTIHNILYKNTL